MAQVVISDEQREQILAAGGPVDLVDASGEVVGRATAAQPEPTLAELRALAAGTEWVTTDELMARLRSLTKCG